MSYSEVVNDCGCLHGAAQMRIDVNTSVAMPGTEILRDEQSLYFKYGAVLDCNKYQELWVEWTDGLIRLGLGPRRDNIAVRNLCFPNSLLLFLV